MLSSTEWTPADENPWQFPLHGWHLFRRPYTRQHGLICPSIRQRHNHWVCTTIWRQVHRGISLVVTNRCGCGPHMVCLTFDLSGHTQPPNPKPNGHRTDLQNKTDIPTSYHVKSTMFQTITVMLRTFTAGPFLRPSGLALWGPLGWGP